MKRNRQIGIGLLTTAVLASGGAAQSPFLSEVPEPRGGPQGPLWSVLDADADGSISAVEMDNAGVALQALDQNHNGKLNGDELRPRGPENRRGETRMERASPHRPPLAKDDAERRILSVLDDLDRNYRQQMNVSVSDGRLLRLLTESIGAKHVVELGTFNGYSSLWMCLGLRATGGKLTTYEIDAEIIREARGNFRRAGVEGIVTVVEGDAHRTVKELQEPIDLLFLDADKEGYVFYLKRLLPLIRPGGLIVAHNMANPPPDPRYLEAVTTNPDLETVFLLMDGAGVGVTLKKKL